MTVHLSAAFYKATINKFSLVKDDPLAFPILLSFLEKASQNTALLRGAKEVVSDDEKFKAFYQKTRSSLPPHLAQIIKQQEEEIREELHPAIEAETRNEMRVHDLETELRLRKEYDERADKKEQERQKHDRDVIGKMIQLQLESQQKIDEFKKQHDDFVDKSEKQAKNDKIHRNIAYAVSAISLAVGVFGVAVSWPGVVDELTGHKSGAGNNGGLQIRLASSGQCQPSDVRIEVKKDGTPTLPTSGSVCLVVPNDPTAANGQTPTPLPPNGGANDPLTGRSWLDMLNDGQAVKLFKQDGSSICVRMPKPLPCVGAEALPVTTSQIQKAPSLDKRRVARHGRRYLHHRTP